MEIRQVVGLILALALAVGGLLLLFRPSGGVAITWETASEVNTQGFNLYRADGTNGTDFVQVNDQLIPSRGDPLTGASYEVLDEDTRPGNLYTYQIEEVEWDGRRHRYPETVLVRAGLSRSLLIFEGSALLLVAGALLYHSLKRDRPARATEAGRDS